MKRLIKQGPPWLLRTVLLGVLLAFGSQIHAQLAADGGEVQVNTTSANSQRNPAVAMDTAGNYVVVWETYIDATDKNEIRAQLYNADGSANGSEINVTNGIEWDQRFPRVCMAPNGDFVVAWQSDREDNDSWGCYARRYNADGTAKAADFRFNSTTAGDQIHPDVACDSNGNFVFVFATNHGGDFDVYRRRYLESGAAQESQVLVNSTTAGHQTHPKITSTKGGEFMITWQSEGQDSSGSGIMYQTYDNTGTVDVSETIVNSTQSGNQEEPSIANDLNGNFIIVWGSYGQDGDHFGVFAQLFDSTGATSGSEFQINQTTNKSQHHAEVAMTEEGTFVVAWTSYGQDGNRDAVIARPFKDDGSSLGDEVTVNSTTTNFQQLPDVVQRTEDDTLMIVWQDGLHNSSSTNDGSEYGVYQRRYTAKDTSPPNAVCQNITVYLDGSGNVSIVAADVDGGSTDNCGIVTYAINNNAWVCNDTGANVTTLTVTDEVGLSDACVAAVIVQDTTSPTAVCQNLTVYLDGTGNASVLDSDPDNGSTDNCGVGSYTLSQKAFTCSDAGANNLTLTVKDVSSNSDVCSTTITVLDTAGPTAVCQNITVYLDGSGSATITGADLDNGSTDNCSGSLGLSPSQSSFGCGDVGANTVTLTVTDPGGNTSNCTSTVTVSDTTSPSASCFGSITEYLDGSGNVTLAVNDIANGISDGCGILSSVLDTSAYTCNDVGAHTVTLTVTDSNSNTTSCSTVVTIQDSSAATALCSNVTLHLDGSGNASLASGDIDNGSSDNCGIASLSLNDSTFTCSDTGANTVTLTVLDINSNSSSCNSTVTVIDSTSPTAACSNLTVYLDNQGNATLGAVDVDNGSSDNCSGFSMVLSTGAFDCNDVGTNSVTLTVTDASGNASTCNSTVTVSDTTSPTAVCKNASLALDGTGNATLTTGDIDNASDDNCGVNSLSLSQTAFSCNDIGSTTVTLTVSDPNGNSSTCSASVTISDNENPTAVCQNQTVYLDGSGNASVTANDVDNGSNDNCSVSVSLNTTSFTCNEIGANTVVLTATDGSGNTNSCQGTVTVTDSTSPTAACQSLTVYLDGSGSASITAGDVDNGSSDNCGVANTSVSPSSFTCSNAGANTVTLTVTDGSSNTSTCTSTVTVSDSTSPTAVCQNITVYLDGSGNASITAGDVDGGSTDNCGVNSTSANPTSFTCNDLGSNTVTLTVDDAGGNSSNCTSTVTVVDSTAPTAVCQNINVFLDGAGSATITASDVDNGSADNCGVSLSVNSTSFTCTEIGNNSVTLTVTDPSNNTATCSATVNVADTTSPTVTCQNISVFLDGTGNASITSGDVTSNSSDNCSVSNLQVSTSSFTCNDVGANSVTVTATDGSGNTSTCTSTVTINDSVAPVASCQGATFALDAQGNATASTTNINNGSSDNCAIDTMTLSQTAFDCSHLGNNTVTLTVTDTDGNTATCNATVTIADQTAPTAVCKNATLTLNSGGSASLTQNDVDSASTDNCSIAFFVLSQTTFDCSDIGQNTVTASIGDPAGNGAGCTVTVTVVDNQAPFVTCKNTTVYLDANGDGSTVVDSVIASTLDNCGVDTAYMAKTTFDCNDAPGTMVTVTVEDSSGNQGTCQATIAVNDTMAPTALCLNDDLYLSASGTATPSSGTMDGGTIDNCGAASVSFSPASFDCSDIGPNTVTRTVSDPGGNTSSCTATLTVHDTIAPDAQCQNDTVYLDALGSADIVAADVDAASDDNCSISTTSVDSTSFDCSEIGANAVVLTVTDGSGNTDTCHAMVQVLDTIAPMAMCKDDTIYLDSLGTVSITVGDVDNGSSDNCAIDSISINKTMFGGTDIGVNNVTLTVTDSSGNVDSCIAAITVDDTMGTAIIKTILTDWEIAAFPNPTAGELHVNVTCGTCKQDDVSIVLTAMNGVVLLELPAKVRKGRVETMINMADYAVGSYLLMVRNKGETKTKQIIRY